MTDSPPSLAIHATGLVKEWDTGPTLVRALRGVDLQVRRGEKLAILGKSGSGKSTLLNLLGGLDRPTTGQIEVCGRRLDSMSRDELALYRLQVVGMVFQSFHLVPSRTALGNVELPLVFAGVSATERRARAESALAAVGLGHRLHHKPAELSGGEQQRVAFARALVNRPALLLADEPTGNLDTENAAAILELLEAQLRDSGATMVLVTHDEELAERLSHRVLWMRDGILNPGDGEPGA